MDVTFGDRTYYEDGTGKLIAVVDSHPSGFVAYCLEEATDAGVGGHVFDPNQSGCEPWVVKPCEPGTCF